MPMKFKVFGINMKYKSRIFFFISIFLLGVLFTYSLSTYFYTRRISIENNYEYSKKILYQMRYNVNTMDETVKNICKYLFFNGEVQEVMYDSRPDLLELSLRFNKLNKWISSSNPNIHSFYIYNHYTKTFYSSFDSIFFEDEQLKELLRSYRNGAPKLKPIARKIKNPYGCSLPYSNVFTYIMYDDVDSAGDMEGAVIININANWLYNNIKSINMAKANSNEMVFILDGENNYVDNTLADEQLKNSLKRELSVKFRAKGNDKLVDYFMFSHGNARFFVTYAKVEQSRMTLVKLQPYHEAFGNIVRLQVAAIIITIIFLIITLGVAIPISTRIYKPVDSLVKEIKVSTNHLDSHENDDEFSYLKKIYRDSEEKLETYEKERYSSKDILKKYWLKRLLMNYNELTEAELHKIIKSENLQIDIGKNTAVVILRIDKFKDFLKKYTIKDRELLRFASINIVNEVLGAHFTCEGTDIDEISMAIIVKSNEEINEFEDILEELLHTALRYIKEHYDFSVTAAISRFSAEKSKLSDAYDSASKLSMYRIVSGFGSVLTWNKVSENEGNAAMGYSQALDAKLLEGIRKGDVNEIREALGKIMQEISTLRFEAITLSITHLIDLVRSVCEELSKTYLKPVYMDFTMLYREILEHETLHEVHEKILQTIDQINDGGVDSATVMKHTIISDTLRSLIDNGYSDGSICLASLADMVKMSPKHAGNIFRSKTGMSISEYINEVRLKKATELLEKSDLNINNIFSRVGFENESYFYRLFKKKYGVTPREYALKRVLSTSEHI